MGRPRMTRRDYYAKYHKVIFELRCMEMSMRRIASQNHIGLSTVMRIKHKCL